MTEYNLNGILFKDITTELNNGRVTVRANVENNTGEAVSAQVVEVTVFNLARTEQFVFQGHIQAMAVGGTDQFNETHETSNLNDVGDLEFNQIIELPDVVSEGKKYSNIKILNNGESKSTIFMWVENNTSDVIPAGYYNFALVDASNNEVAVLSKYINEIAVGQEIQVVLESNDLDYTTIKKVSSFKMEKEPVDTEKLREDVDELQVETTGISNELDLVKEDVADLKTATGNVETRLDTVETNLETLTNKESAFETATNTAISNLETKHDEDIADINTEINNLKTSDRTIKTDIINIKEDITEIKNNAEEIEGDITILTNKENTLETNLATANNKINANTTQINTNKSDITSIKADIRTINTNVADAQNDIRDLQRTDLTVRTDIINLKDADTEIKGDVRDITNRVTTLENKSSASTGNIETLQAEVNQLKVGMGNVVDKNTEQTIAIADLRTKLGVNDEKTAENKAEITTLKNNVSGINANVTELGRNISNLNSEITSAKARIDNIEPEIPTIKAGVENNTEYIREVEETADNNKSRLDTLEPKVEDNTSKILVNKNAIESAETDILALKGNVTDINDSLDGIREDIDALEEKHDEDMETADAKISRNETNINEAQDELTRTITSLLDLADRVTALEEGDPLHPEDPDIPTSPTTIEKIVAQYLKEHIHNLLCVIIPRHDTSSNWSLNDPVLSFGEYGVEDDTHRIKRGNGVDKWADLDYETFGIENLIATKAEDISYDPSKSGISKIDVQSCLDYVLENLLAMRQEVDLKEVVKNKAYIIDPTKISDITYPSTKAVYSYIQNIFDGLKLVPENPTTGTYSLVSINGIMQWIESTNDDHTQIVINTQDIADLKDRTTELETKVEDLDVDAINDRLDGIDTTIADVRTDLDTQGIAVQNNTSDINAVKTNITTINGRLDTVDGALDDISDSLVGQGERIATNEADIADLKIAVEEAGKVETVNNVPVDEGTKNITLDGTNIVVDKENRNTTIARQVEDLIDMIGDAIVSSDAHTDEKIAQEVIDRDQAISEAVAGAGKVDTINGIEPDENKNITLTGDNIKYHTDTEEVQYITIGEAIDNNESNIQALSDGLSSETAARENADTALEERIDTVEQAVADIPEYGLVESTTTEGYAKTYSLTKDGTEIGTKINIPKDLVVKSGSVKVVETADEPYEGAEVGDKYVDLELNDENEDHIYIPVKDLVDTYTGKDGDKIKVEVNSNNEIEATIKTGSLEVKDFTDAARQDMLKSVGLMAYANKTLERFNNLGGHDSILEFTSTGDTKPTFDNKKLSYNTNAEEVNFDPQSSGLESTKLSPAIRELKGLIDNAGNVDTVNNISADSNKNIQIDASQINIDDTAETKTTVKAKIEALNTLVAQQQATITEQNEKIAAQDEEIANMKALIGNIQEVLEYINRGDTELEEVDGVLTEILGEEG